MSVSCDLRMKFDFLFIFPPILSELQVEEGCLPGSGEAGGFEPRLCRLQRIHPSHGRPGGWRAGHKKQERLKKKL